jgi:Fe-Mn family superoxide dismutase
MLNTKIKDLQFPRLPYGFSALEPHIDARTMEIHYTKHHRGYFDKLMAAVKDTDYEGSTLKELFGRADRLPAAVRNNGGGFYNHALFWNVLSAEVDVKPSGKFAEAIRDAFGTFENMQKEFNTAAANRFGSGWAWLIVGADGKLAVTSTPNQDNPWMNDADVKGTPVLGIDVWEHAYYLKYQNRRPEYIDAFWYVVNWAEVEKNYYDTLKPMSDR